MSFLSNLFTRTFSNNVRTRDQAFSTISPGRTGLRNTAQRAINQATSDKTLKKSTPRDRQVIRRQLEDIIGLIDNRTISDDSCECLYREYCDTTFMDPSDLWSFIGSVRAYM